jgi:hypothetical protein
LFYDAPVGHLLPKEGFRIMIRCFGATMGIIILLLPHILLGRGYGFFVEIIIIAGSPITPFGSAIPKVA